MLKALRSKMWVRMAAILIFATAAPIVGAGILTLGLLEESVRDDAARKHKVMANLGGALVRDYIQRGTEKLVTVSKLLEEELAEQGQYGEGNKGYRAAVVENLNNLVQPPDIYLEIQYYAKGNEPQFVDRAQNEEYSQRQQIEPDYKDQQRKQIAENSQRGLVRDPMYNNQNWVEPQLEKNFGFPTLPLSVPVGEGKAQHGALVAYLDFREVSKILDAVSEDGYHVALLNGNGETLAEAGTMVDPQVGEAMLAGHSDWTVEVHEPSSRVMAAVGQVREQAMLWIGLAIVLAVGLSLGISARIVRPVGALTLAAQRMEAGDLKARAGINRDDEIGRLGRAFDSMAAELERLDEAKSEFVGNVSHELRTPLTSIRVSIANLLDGVLGPLDDKQKSTLTRLKGDVNRMILMVNDLLEMAKLDAGALEARKEKIDLAIVANECIAGVEPMAKEKKIEMSVQGAGTAEADRAMINRVLTNLLDNAVKFTPEGGKVSVNVADGELKVADSGPGVPAEGLFEKFRQGTQEGVKNRGVGLGLAIVKKLIDLHGGSIEVKNGEGATFIVKL